jgi:hypothetical protein
MFAGKKLRDYCSGASNETDEKAGVCIIKLFMAVIISVP